VKYIEFRRPVGDAHCRPKSMLDHDTQDYTHLTEEQQYQIYEGLVEKLSHRGLAK